jgi:hypothetical protein
LVASAADALIWLSRLLAILHLILMLTAPGPAFLDIHAIVFSNSAIYQHTSRQVHIRQLQCPSRAR